MILNKAIMVHYYTYFARYLTVFKIKSICKNIYALIYLTERKERILTHPRLFYDLENDRDSEKLNFNSTLLINSRLITDGRYAI